MRTPAGGVGVPNHVFEKAVASAASLVPAVLPSMKITDDPAGMLVTPRRATEAANEPELSSMRQPVISTSNAVVLVTSNQSAPTGLLPLDHGAASEMNSLPAVPGEPISFVSFTARNAPLMPTTLRVETVALLRAAALLKVAKSGPAGDVPKTRFAWSTPSPL